MKTIYKLTKEELGDTIVNYIGILNKQLFFPYKIVNSNLPILPDVIEIEIEYVPRGSTIEEAKHKFRRGQND